MSARADFAADVKRYPFHVWWSDRTIYAIAVMRFGQWVEQQKGTRRKLLRHVHYVVNMFTTAFSGVDIARGAEIGPGLRIYHGTGLVIGPKTRIGANCTLLHGVTLGNRRLDDDCPTLGRDVEIGAGAIVIGAIEIGDGVHIGAGSVVLHDVPAYGQVAGNPGRLLSIREP
jgi:serine O-acetyltransferase